MGTLYVVEVEPAFGEAYFDGEGKFITFSHESDGQWNFEHFNPIMEHYDVDVSKLTSISYNNLNVGYDDNFDLWKHIDTLESLVLSRINE